MAKETTPAPNPAEPIVGPTAVSSTPATAPVVPKGPRSYLVMMLLAVLMLPSGLARAYRGEQIGWTRFWIYVGATAASFIPLLNILGAIAMIVLAVWGVIDVFQLRNTRTDSEGGLLVTSERDEKFAHGFYVLFLVGLILTGVGIVLALIFGAFIINGIMNGFNGSRSNSDYYNNSYNSSDYLRRFESQAR